MDFTGDGDDGVQDYLIDLWDWNWFRKKENIDIDSYQDKYLGVWLHCSFF